MRALRRRAATRAACTNPQQHLVPRRSNLNSTNALHVGNAPCPRTSGTHFASQRDYLRPSAPRQQPQTPPRRSTSSRIYVLEDLGHLRPGRAVLLRGLAQAPRPDASCRLGCTPRFVRGAWSSASESTVRRSSTSSAWCSSGTTSGHPVSSPGCADHFDGAHQHAPSLSSSPTSASNADLARSSCRCVGPVLAQTLRR